MRMEIEQFFDNYEQALLSNNLDQIITFYTVPYTAADYVSGSKITLSSWEDLRTYLNTYLGLEESEIVEDSFELTDVTFSSETRAIVLAEEHWVQTADGEAWEATDSLRITLIKISGNWKFQKIELLGWRGKRG
ncbi:MAG: hypothetical protein PWP60_298 [Candidatus Atribacteria bacterium]|nr:hypothetical protein [Candidatus Atribacteria bacterium]MDI3530449.1 hypothetical protein [Candidatus Atribacteria bacterium]